MQETIRVHVVEYKDRANLVMRYRCPLTGKQVQKSSGTKRKKEAAKRAAQWEAEINEGRYKHSPRMGWQEFREFYEDSTAPTMKASTAERYAITFNAFEHYCRPQRVADLNTGRVTAFASELRKPQTRTLAGGRKKTTTLAPASVARHLRHLKAIARWANKQGLLPDVPHFEMPTKASGARRMKGRPITDAEFQAMLDATEGYVGAAAAESWKLVLRGLWWSGLRLSEAVALRWDHEPGGVSVVMDGKHSLLHFDGEAQKSGKAQLVPLAPEAVQLLEPIQQSTGYVFNPMRLDGEPMIRDREKWGRYIGRIGKAAGVVTEPEKGRHATAHDLRRAFGKRWAKLVMPARLMELMRHATIETTMTFYVGSDARSTASELWDVLGTTLGTIPPGDGSEKPAESAKLRVYQSA